MRPYLSFLIILMALLAAATPVSADEVVFGRISSIDRETGRITLETIPTLLQPTHKRIDIDFSPLDPGQWAQLEQEDTIRVWINTAEGSSVYGVRSFQLHSSASQQRQTDPTGVRQRLSSQRAMDSGRSMGAPTRSGGGGSGGRR